MWIVWRAKSMPVAICGSPTILLLKPEGYLTDGKTDGWLIGQADTFTWMGLPLCWQVA